MKIAGMEKLSLVDYDGYCAVTLFTSRCMYRCPYCHNAPLILDAFGELDHEEIYAHLEKRRNVIDAVVISGGEPTLEPDLYEFIVNLKERFDLKIKLDTAGVNTEVVKRLIDDKLIDYVAMDIKTSPSEYSKVCGVENTKIDNVLSTIELLKEDKVDYEFRTTLAKEFHSEEVMRDISLLLFGAKRYYLQKLVISDTCFDPSLTPIKTEVAETFKRIMEENKIPTELRSY